MKPATERGRTPVVCLLPARNAAADLPGFFESAARFCDAVVALDDGSTDETRGLLEASPLVKVVLTNPRREDYRGWDDAANRNRLLAAAGGLNPRWIFSMDADERLDAADATALRDFLDRDALPGCAYGFRVVPMQGTRTTTRRATSGSTASSPTNPASPSPPSGCTSCPSRPASPAPPGSRRHCAYNTSAA
ncbi:MAG TPA: glycosyltransferase family 2 protein [Rubrobacter sp.]|nr:glycosyltransferase family 2 protein [Rubrobacter sp.]